MHVKQDHCQPVTVLSGLLEGGTVTLLSRVLRRRKGRCVAAIQSEMPEVNIDAALVERGGAAFSAIDEEQVEVRNVCICRALGDDLLVEVSRLVLADRKPWVDLPNPFPELSMEGMEGEPT